MTAEPDRRRGETARSLGALSAAGLSMVVAIVLGAGGGYVLDGWLSTSPWFFLLGFVLGVVAGMRNVFKAASTGSSSDRTGAS